MEAIMIAGVAVVAIGGWYSAMDMLADLGIRVRRRSRSDAPKKHGVQSRDRRVPVQQRIKQMAGVNI